MKWLRTLIIFDRDDIASTSDWKNIHDSYVRAIQSIDFPEGSGSLTLRPKIKLSNGRWKRNGVVYLKNRFLKYMVEHEKWQPETGLDIGRYCVSPDLYLFPGLSPYQEAIKSDFGDFDFVTTMPDKTHVAIEWETGNISSSHRTMNKLSIALKMDKIKIGVLVLPSRELYKLLTDRVGNIEELSVYLSMWKEVESNVKRGLLAITVVEHDHLTDDKEFEFLPTGNDGMAYTGNTKSTKTKKFKKR